MSSALAQATPRGQGAVGRLAGAERRAGKAAGLAGLAALPCPALRDMLVSVQVGTLRRVVCFLAWRRVVHWIISPVVHHYARY